MTHQWWTQPFRAVQTNLREIDAGLDVEQVLDFIEDYGADTWLLSTGGIIANYPSRLDCQTVNPALAERSTGDLVGDAVEAAAHRGIRVLSRMDFSKIDARRAEEHPEWCFVSPEGAQQVYNGYRSVCPSGQYYQQKMFDVVSEVLENYPVSGFFFNMMHFNERDYSRQYWGVCHCSSCLEGFQEFAPGAEHPTGGESAGYAQWKKYSAGVLDTLNARMREHISGIDSDVALILREDAHITYHEANNAVGRPLWHHLTSESLSAHRSRDRQRTVFVNCVGFVDMPYRWASEEPHHFAQYLVQAIAHGGSPSTYVMGTPATGEYEVLGVGRQLTRFHRDNSDLYSGLHSAATVGLVRGLDPEGPAPARRLAEFRGCYLSLTERHVPFDVVRREVLPDLDPTRYDLLILPDLGPLSHEEIEAVESLLGSGATVVATGDSAWKGPSAQIGPEVPFVRRKARYTSERDLYSLHLPVGHRGDHVPVIGGFEVLEATEEADADWPALGRSLYGPPEKCYGNRTTAHPGWVSGTVGPGRLAFLPWRPGQVYYECGLQRARDAWVDKVLQLLHRPVRPPQLLTDLPAQVQTVLGENSAGSTVVHLLNLSGALPQRFVEPIPVAPATLRVAMPQDPSRVRARVAGQDLTWVRDGAFIQIDTPPLELFEAIEFR